VKAITVKAVGLWGGGVFGGQDIHGFSMANQ
jgi:hypothetical protein